jgi:excinuclease ABC subunit C
MSTGLTLIKNTLPTLPQSPGVYRMVDAKGKVLYVGKAKNLAKRVPAYTHLEKLPYRLQRMVSHTASMEIVTTTTEAEALLLEANLIKSLKPRYNILLKDDKSFPYILVSTDHEFPQVMKHRGARSGKGHYFGPFASAGDVNKAITQLQRIFLLRPCADSVFSHRTRPCLEYQIKRCSAPCVGKISKEDYAGLVAQALDFLSGKSRHVQEQLVKAMEEASNAMAFEQAAIYRDRIAALTQIQATQHVNVASVKDADILGLYRQGEQVCIQVFFYRGGQHFGNKSYFPSQVEEESDAEILEAFLTQFYQTNLPPRQVVVSLALENHAVLEEALSSMAENTVTLIHPKTGDKASIVEKAVENAKEALERHVAEQIAQAEVLEALRVFCALEQPIARVEVYDNSHMMGDYPVGAMVVAGKEGLMHRAYRRFTIKSKLTPGDDYAMMREVITRRFARLQKEDPEHTQGIWPDVIVIDGGASHLKVVCEVLEGLGLSQQKVISISKGPERKVGEEYFHIPGKTPFTLPKNDPLARYLQTIRDEAHRYAIGSHRKQRAKSIEKSALDAIPGIGTKRKKALLTHFGSAKGVQDASVEDLMKVEGISKEMAEGVWNYFR